MGSEVGFPGVSSFLPGAQVKSSPVRCLGWKLDQHYAIVTSGSICPSVPLDNSWILLLYIFWSKSKVQAPCTFLDTFIMQVPIAPCSSWALDLYPSEKATKPELRLCWGCFSGKASQIFIDNGIRWTLLGKTIPRWFGSPVKLVVVENPFKSQNHSTHKVGKHLESNLWLKGSKDGGGLSYIFSIGWARVR